MLIGAELVNAEDDILLVSRKGEAIRFRADDTQLRPMGRRHLGRLGHEVPRRRRAAVAVGDPRRAGGGRGGRRGARRGRGGIHRAGRAARRQGAVRLHDHQRRVREADPIRLPPPQSRGGLGIKAMALANEDRGVLVGAFIVEEGDEILSITQTGQVVRSPINDQFRATGRSTMGVKFVTPKSGDAVAVVARSIEAKEEEALAAEAGEVVDEAGVEPVPATPLNRWKPPRVQQSRRPTRPDPTRSGRVRPDDGASRRANRHPYRTRPQQRRDRRPRPLGARIRPGSAPPPTSTARTRGPGVQGGGQEGRPAWPGAPPGPAPAHPDRPLVGDEDRVPALDGVRHRHRRVGADGLVGARRGRCLGLDQPDRGGRRGRRGVGQLRHRELPGHVP